MARSGPPAYAWDWFARQRLLWREARARLAGAAAPVAPRYHAVDARADVLALLRRDYPTDPIVRDVVHRVVRDLTFLGRTDVGFAELGIANPPRGLRWWWTALTGEEVDAPRHAATAPVTARTAPAQLSLDDVHEGYGG